MERGTEPAQAKVIGTHLDGAPSATTDGASSLEQRLAAALAQQMATSEILRVISASSTDVQPVLDAVTRHAALLCKSPFARVFLADGDMLRSTAHFSADGESVVQVTVVSLKRTSVTGRAVVDRATVHHEDVTP